jgi:hypothetical protein
MKSLWEHYRDEWQIVAMNLEIFQGIVLACNIIPELFFPTHNFGMTTM